MVEVSHRERDAETQRNPLPLYYLSYRDALILTNTRINCHSWYRVVIWNVISSLCAQCKPCRCSFSMFWMRGVILKYCQKVRNEAVSTLECLLLIIVLAFVFDHSSRSLCLILLTPSLVPSHRPNSQLALQTTIYILSTCIKLPSASIVDTEPMP